MAMTEEQLMQLITRAVATAVGASQAAMAPAIPVGAGGGGNGGGGGHHGGRLLKEKGFSEVGKLNRGQDQWAEWSYDFKIAMATMSPEMRRTLEVIQDYPHELDLKATIELDPDRAERINLTLRVAELFQILVLKTDGEAKLLVKSATDEDGIRAWQMLHRHYHRKTFAKAIRDHRDVLYPKHLRDLTEVVKGVMEWEEKLNRVEKSYGVIPEMLKIAALVEMLPAEIKDMVMMQPEEHQDYPKLKQKIFAWTANKIPLDKGPVPMDIGAMSYYCGQCGGEEAEVDIGAINGTCYRCGGWGHAARECATPWKGKGKGEAEGAKGKGKGGGNPKGGGKGKGGADKGKGKGKGYQGACWKCGRVGHKSAECRQIGSVDEEAEEEENEEEEEIGVHTVWHIGAVQADVLPVYENFKKSEKKMEIGAIDIGKVEAMEVDGGTKTRYKGNKDQQSKSISITLDSGAGASCWPEKLWKNIPMNPKTKGVKFSAANGTELKYYGNKNVQFVPKDMVGRGGSRSSGSGCEMKFHVTDTTKPLASAMAMVKMGNRVVLDDGMSYIENKATGERVMLKESGGTYVFEVEGKPFGTNKAVGFPRQGQ
jgi:hypothetical protein